MKKIGIIWVNYTWKPGENCHFENITCPDCLKMQTAIVLHTKPDFHKLHVCDSCGAFIGRFRWHTVEVLKSCPELERTLNGPVLITPKKIHNSPEAITGAAPQRVAPDHPARPRSPEAITGRGSPASGHHAPAPGPDQVARPVSPEAITGAAPQRVATDHPEAITQKPFKQGQQITLF